MQKLFLLSFCLICVLMTQVAWGGTRSGIVTVEVDLSGQEKGNARLWLPYPVTDHNQRVFDLKVKGDYSETGVYTDSVFGTPILYAEWPAGVANRKMMLSFAVERREVIRREFPKTEPAWNRADYAEWLKPTSFAPISNEVQKLSDTITKGKKTVTEKARAIYDWTCDSMYRDSETIGCGKGDVCALLRKPGGKCTDISSVFIALCRAAGVPAREVFGIRLGKKELEDVTTWQHCWTEFFVPGYGWVPADPADVRKAMLVENLGINDRKAKEYREYFWGGIDPYRVAIAVGRDLVLNPPQAGPPLNTFGYPYAEVQGNAINFYAPKSFVYRITYREK